MTTTCKNVSLSILAGCLCSLVACIPQDTASDDPPALRDTDLVYVVGGGFAGIYHAVRITPDGQMFVSDDYRQEIPINPIGALSNRQGNQLNALLENWDALPAITEEPICCDGFGYGITYRGRTLSWADGQANVPDRLREIAGLVASFEPN